MIHPGNPVYILEANHTDELSGKCLKPIPGKNNETNLFNRWTSQSTTLSLVRPGPLTRQFLAPVEPLPTFSHLSSRDAAGRYQFSQCSQKWGQRKSIAMPAAVQGDHMKQQFKKCEKNVHKKAFCYACIWAPNSLHPCSLIVMNINYSDKMLW